MTGSIMIGDRRVELSATLGAMLRYKQQFGREYNDDINELNMLKESGGEEYYKALGVMGIKLIWAMAKTADNNIPSFDVWLNIFDGVNIAPIMAKTMALYNQSLGEHAESANTDDEENGDECFSTEALAATCLACGISICDLDRLTVDTVVKIITEIAELRGSSKDKEEEQKNESGNIRRATPEDIQAFFG